MKWIRTILLMIRLWKKLSGNKDTEEKLLLKTGFRKEDQNGEVVFKFQVQVRRRVKSRARTGSLYTGRRPIYSTMQIVRCPERDIWGYILKQDGTQLELKTIDDLAKFTKCPG